MTSETAVFLDSNILIYAIADDPHRTELALALVEAGGIISAQVRTEVSHVLPRKQSPRGGDAMEESPADLCADRDVACPAPPGWAAQCRTPAV